MSEADPGEVLLGDRRGKPWIVGIRHPRDDGEVVLRIPLQDEAVSTSGDYERYFVEDGVRYHHILLPDSGDSARDVISATVVGPDAVMTDALSTSLFVMGVTKGLQLIESLRDYEAILIDALANDSDYGLAASLFSRDADDFERCRGRVRTGILNWNKGTVGASGKLPFGGLGRSGNDRRTLYNLKMRKKIERRRIFKEKYSK